MTTPDILFVTVLLLSSMLSALLFLRTATTTKTFGLTAALLFALFALSHTVPQASVAVSSTLLAAGATALALIVSGGVVGAGTVLPLFIVVATVATAAATFYFGRLSVPLSLLAASTTALAVIGAADFRMKRREAVLIVASAVALGASGAAFVISGPRNALLFGAAALTGIAIAVSPVSRVVVNNQGWRRRRLLVRRKS